MLPAAPPSVASQARTRPVDPQPVMFEARQSTGSRCYTAPPTPSTCWSAAPALCVEGNAKERVCSTGRQAAHADHGGSLRWWRARPRSLGGAAAVAGGVSRVAGVLAAQRGPTSCPAAHAAGVRCVGLQPQGQVLCCCLERPACSSMADCSVLGSARQQGTPAAALVVVVVVQKRHCRGHKQATAMYCGSSWHAPSPLSPPPTVTCCSWVRSSWCCMLPGHSAVVSCGWRACCCCSGQVVGRGAVCLYLSLVCRCPFWLACSGCGMLLAASGVCMGNTVNETTICWFRSSSQHHPARVACHGMSRSGACLWFLVEYSRSTKHASTHARFTSNVGVYHSHAAPRP